MVASEQRPRVAVIGTGGTISFDGRDSLDAYEYMEFGQRHDIDTVIARFPELSTVADVQAVPFRNLSSAAISPADWLDLTALIHNLTDGPDVPDGIVVTHGTAWLRSSGHALP